MWWALFFCCLPGLRGFHLMVVSYFIQIRMSFAISWWSLLVYLLAKIAFFAPGRTAWPGMHMCLSAFAPLHTQCMFVQRLLWLLQQTIAPGYTPQVCYQDWDRCDWVFQLFFFFALCYFLIFFIWCARQAPQLSPVLQSCGQAFSARQAASHTGKQTGRASELNSQHPHPRTFKLLKPAHHSAGSLPQLLFISLENVMLWLRAGCYGDELSTHLLVPACHRNAKCAEWLQTLLCKALLWDRHCRFSVWLLLYTSSLVVGSK